MIVTLSMSEPSDVTSAPSGGIRGVANEAPNSLIAIVRFDGNNYFHWFQSAQLFITGKGEPEYLKRVR